MTKHSELFCILTLGVMRNANTALCKAAKNSNARIIMSNSYDRRECAVAAGE